jgi:hypothetical protein
LPERDAADLEKTGSEIQLSTPCVRFAMDITTWINVSVKVMVESVKSQMIRTSTPCANVSDAALWAIGVRHGKLSKDIAAKS